MKGNEREIDLLFKTKIQPDINDVKKVVSELKNQLNSLEIPKNASKDFERNLEKLNSELQNFEALVNRGVENLADNRRVEASWKKVSTLISNIGIQFKDLEKFEIFPKSVTANIEKANKALESYQNKLAAIQKNKTYQEKVKSKDEAQLAYKNATADWKREQEKFSNLEKRVASDRTIWNQNHAEEYAEQKKQISELTKQIQQQTDALKNQQQTQEALRASGILTMKNTVAKVYSDLAKSTKDQLDDEIEKKKAAEERLRIAQQEQQIAKNARTTSRREVTKLQNRGMDTNSPEFIKKADDKIKKEQAYLETVDKVKIALEEVQSAEAAIAKTAENLEKIESQIDLAKTTVKQIEDIKKQRESLESSKRAIKDAAESHEDFKNKLESGESSLRDQKTAVETYEQAMKQAETIVQKFNAELRQIELEGTTKEWKDLVEIVKAFTGIDLTNFQGDLSKLTQTLAEYKTNQIKAGPESIKKLQEYLDKIYPSLQRQKQALSDNNDELDRLKKNEQDLKNLKEQVLDFFSVGNAIQIFREAVHYAIDTVKELDSVMTETAVVTDFSIGDMWEKLPKYSKQATQLGASIKSLYEATTLYYQQGLDSQQAMEVGTETMKMARIANMDAAQATQAMTAALRGFNMEINELSAARINDVYSELAAVTAADTNQIAAAMSKTASIASSANMEFETTAALLAQIIETTQEAPETAGTAMKTIIARFTEVKKLFSQGMLTGEDEEGEVIDINRIDTALKTVGISLKDFLNGTKGIDDIFLELASKWDTLDLATQRYIATTAAGSRQQSRFLAMMSNYDRTMELVTAANNSAGASQKQFEKTLDSLEAKLQRLNNAWQEFTMGLANNEVIKSGVDILTLLLETINNITGQTGEKGLSGLATTFLRFLTIMGGLKLGKVALDGFFNSFSEVGEQSSLVSQALQKIVPNLAVTANSFDKVSSVGTLLNNVLKGLRGSWDGLIGQTKNWGAFLSNSKNELVAFGAAVKNAGSLTKALGVVFSSVGGKIAIFIAIIAAFKWVYKEIQKATPEGKLDAAREAAEKAGMAADEAAESFNKLKASLDSLDDKYSAIENLTYGTQEWRDAVQEVNNEVLSLIDNYPELSSFLQSKEGILSFDTKKEITSLDGTVKTVDSIFKEYSNRVFSTQAAKAMSQIDVQRAQNNLNYKNLNSYKQFDPDSGANTQRNQEITEALARAAASGELESFRKEGQSDADLTRSWIRSKFNDHTLGITYEKSFDLNAIKEFGQSLIEADAAINNFADAAVSSSMNMAVLQGKAGTVLYNLDKDIARQQYNDEYNRLLEDYNSRKLTEAEKQKYAQLNNYRLTNGKYYNKDGQEVEGLTDSDIKKNLAAQNASENYSSQLEDLSKIIAQGNVEFLGEILSDEGQAISKDVLLKYAKYNEKTGLFELVETDENLSKLAKETGLGDITDLKELFGENFVLELSKSFESAGDRIIKQRKTLVKNMTKFSEDGKIKNFVTNADLLNKLEDRYKTLDISSILSGVFEKLELTGDQKLSTSAYESLIDIMEKAKGANEIQEALDFFNEIDFSNPINALDTINKEIKTGTGYSKELAMAMKESNSSFLGMSSQLSTLFASADFEEVQEDLDEIIEKNGTIAATDILDLAKGYKSLDKILKNNKTTATGLAKVFEEITNDTLAVEDLTDTVLDALSSFESLNSIAAETVNKLGDFDLGIDENEVGKTALEWAELIQENIEKGAVGNAQNFKILDFLFPGWDNGLESDALVAEMTRLAKKLEGNSQNLRQMWSDLAAGKDYQGLGQIFETATDNKFKGLDVEDTGKEILLTGWEGKNLTSADLVTWISDAYNVSKDLAAMMLTDFKNYSADLATELQANDYTAGIQEAYDNLRQYGNVKLIDEQEIATIAKLLGQSEESIKKSFEDKGVTFTNFYDKEGNIKSFEEIISFMDESERFGIEAGQKWSDTFLKTVEAGSQGIFEQSLNISALEKELSNLGISGKYAEEIKRQAFESIKSGMSDGYRTIISTLENGEKIPITITPEMDYEQYQQQLNKKIQESENMALAEAFKKVFTDSEVDIVVSEDSILTFSETITTTAKETPAEVALTVDETPVTEAINRGIEKSDKRVVIKGSMDPLTITASGVATGSIVLTAYKNGTPNAPRDEDALVGEVGPELIQKADGGAYVAGIQGPEIAQIEKGDTVYTAQETRQIFKKRHHRGMPRYNDGKASGYGDGSSYTGDKKGSGDKDTWENSFDKLYNLVREIDEQLHQRERIERRYEKLLNNIDVSSEKLIKVTQEQLTQLHKEKELQEQLIYNRKQQISLYQNENSDLTKYANVTQNEYGEDILRINWDLIDAVKDSKEGERVETYVNQLEEWFDSLEEAEDALWDIEDSVEDIKNRQKESYVNLLDRVKDAILQSYQDEIDKLGAINDSINDTNSAILNSIQKSVNEQRQDRQNQKTQKSIEDKQRRLAYLQQDTSGANALEILRLQEEISQEQQDYTDSLIDQKISELQNQNDEAAEQRARQIEIAQLQLDQYEKTGQVWEDVNSLLNSALGENGELLKESDLVALLKKSENFEGLSNVAQMSWMSDLQVLVADAVGYLSGEKESQKDELENLNKPIDNIGSSSGGNNPNKPSSGGSSGGGGSLGGGIRSDTDLAVSPNGYNTHGYTVGQVKDLQRKAGIQVDGIWGPATEEAYQTRYESITYLNGKAIIGKGPTASKAEEDLQNKLEKLRDEEILNYNTEKNNIYGKYGNLWTKRHTKARFASGGLADFTGPAWLDGTKSRPEYVLNAGQTQRFFDLIDILDDFKNNTNTTNSQNFGAITYDIDINIDTVKEEADVDMIVEKVQKSITATSKYRANNFVKR